MIRGRPTSLGSEKIVSEIVKHKEKLTNGNNIVSKTNPIWQIIANELNNKVKSSSLHSYVTNDRFNLKKMILGHQEHETAARKSSLDSTTSFSETRENYNYVFILTFGKSEFEELIIESSRQYVDRKGIKKMRIHNILKPNKWTEIFAKKMYDEFRISHGYHFETHYLSSDKSTGSFTGHCKCGSKLKCTILPRIDNEEIVRVECFATKGEAGNCSKRQCRGDTRKEIVNQLEKQSVEAFRAHIASDLMREGDSQEPPHLYKGNVLRTARYEAEQKKYRDKNPLMALSKLKRCPEGANIIRDIGADPVIVHFWSSHQLRVYNYLRKVEHARLCIDATGKLCSFLRHADDEKSQHIFLYIGVLYCSAGQFPVTEMFSESQDTVTISTWLRRWIQSGAHFPKEVVCDSSRALLTACCWAFTGHDTIEKYAEACLDKEMPRSFIRIDVAHYIKNWADFLKAERKPIKKFYLLSIGQLILCKEMDNAFNIVKALLIISLSENGGKGATFLNQSLDYIKNLITENSNADGEVEKIIDHTLEVEVEDMKHNIDTSTTTHNENGIGIHEGKQDVTSNCHEPEDFKKSFLEEWTGTLKISVDEILKTDKGDDLNPRVCPEFATRLLLQLKTLPMWSCISCESFGYGRIPASSAPVESEFNNIKKNILPKQKRIDLAVETLVKYNDGKLKIVNTSLISSDENRQKKRCREIEDINSNTTDRDYLTYLSDEKQSGEFEDTFRRERKALKEIENWRNLGKVTKKQKSLYLNKGSQEIIDMAISDKFRALPIMKNGSSSSLSVVTLEKCKISLVNTCAFDSIFQVLLAAVTDNEKLLRYVAENKEKNELFEIILDVKEKKIQSRTYKSRAKIMLEFWKKTTQPNSIELIDCACNVVSLSNFMMKHTPSFEEMSVCVAGCKNRRIKSLPSVMITDKEMKEPLQKIIQKHVVLPGAKCIKDCCQMMEENQLLRIADLVMIAVDTDDTMEIASIPKNFLCPKTNCIIYNLVGFVNYHGVNLKTRQSTVIGHYTAVCRRGTNWIVYDDLKEKPIRISEKDMVHPELLIYSK